MVLHTYEIDSLPTEMDLEAFLGAMLGSQFMLCHDFKEGKTYVAFEDADAHVRIKHAVAGIGMHEETIAWRRLSLPRYAVGYSATRMDRDGRVLETFRELYSILSHSGAMFLVSFVPASAEQVDAARLRVEEMASRKSIRLTRNLGSRNGSPSATDSMQMELFYESDERRMLLSLLESLNAASMRNGVAYRVSIIFENNAQVNEYIKANLFVFENRGINVGSVNDAYEFAKHADALPLSHACAAGYLSFSERITRHGTITTRYGCGGGNIELGEYLHGSVTGRGETLHLDYRTFNLGAIISGLPGTGKTATAMNLIRQLSRESDASIVVLSPTGEWNAFGRSVGARVIKLYDGTVRLNFFKCDSGINIERFYENLAMLISSASNAGPYKNSLEKSLLSAFRKSYAATVSPDPAEVYACIENAVIEQHGKRSNVGVKLTKHGENVMAALQNLRLLLMNPQFAYCDGEDFSGLLRTGVVFDLSLVSNSMKPFFYALILNQAYGFADMLDTDGNDELRMLMCIEEAQLMLDREGESAATLDLEQRIQDFRKKGIGLMLIAHSVTDISPGIRRLCQTKVYFRQSADVAKYACGDLVFGEEEGRLVTDKLKGLPQGRCAVSYIAIEDGMRVPKGSVFVEVMFSQGHVEAQPEAKVGKRHAKATVITVIENAAPKAGAAVRMIYVGETVFEGVTDAKGRVVAEGLLEGKMYKMLVLGAKRRETREFSIIGGVDTELQCMEP